MNRAELEVTLFCLKISNSKIQISKKNTPTAKVFVYHNSQMRRSHSEIISIGLTHKYLVY